MSNHYTGGYRQDRPWQAYENARDEDFEDEWQPESYGDEWDEARRRQRLTPGQLSEGGPARSGFQRGYSEDWGDDRGGYRGGYRGSDDERAESRGRSNLRYGLNGGYGADDLPEESADQRRSQMYRSRRYESRPEGRRESGGYGFGNSDQAWLREADRRSREQHGGYGERSGHQPYFNDLRSDTRYWSESERGYGRDDQGDQGDHGTLYNLGHRIGEAIGEWFGGSSEREREEARRNFRREYGGGYRSDYRSEYGRSLREDSGHRSGPRGYTRTDARIREDICERLTFTTGLDVSDVSVDVDKGKVTLSGTVRTRSQKYDIEDLADNTLGVNEVENNIRVRRQAIDDGSAEAGTRG
ncbi:BON domain-containing protein [Cupriavidus basilensis]